MKKKKRELFFSDKSNYQELHVNNLESIETTNRSSSKNGYNFQLRLRYFHPLAAPFDVPFDTLLPQAIESHLFAPSAIPFDSLVIRTDV